MTMRSEMNTHFPEIANGFLKKERGLLRFLRGDSRSIAYLAAASLGCSFQFNRIYAVCFLLIEQSIKNMLYVSKTGRVQCPS
jgi:hypothetical protein